MLGFEYPYYCSMMTYETVKPFLNDELTEKDHKVETQGSILDNAIDYLDFAYEKANNKRGISAGRSMMHYRAWLWLLGTDDFDEMTDNYTDYGLPQLDMIKAYLKGLKESNNT